MADKLQDLVIRTRKITMSSGQLREQRQSFAYGNTNIENERITREMVAEADRKIEAESKLTAWRLAEDRHSKAEDAQLLTDPDEIARREAENGLRQFSLAIEIIATYVRDRERPFKLRAGPILQLHKAALDGLHRLAGTFRNTPVKIGGSLHQPPEAAFVSDEVQSMCEYVNENWSAKTAVHLAAYVLWKMNWIHPFADGNGRTARAISYVVLSIKLDSLLPGTPTIPEQIAADKQPYYDALEAADREWTNQKVDVSKLEAVVEAMLSQQLINAVKQAASESD